MKILLTGGGTGGHFFPLIAVAQGLNKLASEKQLADFKLYYLAPEPFNEKLLAENNITFIKGSAGKVRRYFSLRNFLDIFRTGFGMIRALWTMYKLYPDVVFAKGGYASVPAIFAAWFFNIPIVVHESDSVPGRTNKWAGKVARRIALSLPEAAQYFPKEKTAFTGNPIRREILTPLKDGAKELLRLEPSIPVILVLGGSQGAQIINENIIEALPELVKRFSIIHQTGKNNFEAVQKSAAALLENDPQKERYNPFADLENEALRMAGGVADLAVSRAGSMIFEIAAWGVPAILIPITDSNGDHQRKNAYNYARTGAAIVIEENNLTSHILVAEMNRLIDDPAELERMKNAAKGFARIDAADLIAGEIMAIALEHYKKA
jgi:UDP-N-acetylglucosamine--N-acetylmuramyl-(pentapeptide) pyrophosphoryl-undecaprenol N-acetylglucosamine transferase